jgi:FkbM family methyltransferase
LHDAFLEMIASVLANSSHLPTVTLPTGLGVRCVSKNDVGFLYNEIFVNRTYLQCGVIPHRGGVVLDIGGNVGLFAMQAAEMVGPEGIVVSVEPMPDTFAALQHNLAAHRNWCRHSGKPVAADSKALHYGAGAARGHATFTHYPRAAGWGTLSDYEDENRIQRDMEAFLDNALRDGRSGALPQPLASAARALLRLWPMAYSAAASWSVRRMLASKTIHECEVLAISDIIHSEGLEARGVDLLKIDVEGAELAALRGVESHHWPLIHQAVLEVHEHNLEGALAVLQGLAAFAAIEVKQEADMRGTSIFMVYCTRIRRKDGGSNAVCGEQRLSVRLEDYIA